MGPARLLPWLLLASVQLIWGRQFRGSSVSPDRYHIIACNGFPDTSGLSVREEDVGGRSGDESTPAPSLRSIAEQTLWSRSIGYLECDEYWVNLDARRLVFEQAGNDGASCELGDVDHLFRGQGDGDSSGGPRSLVVAVRQRSASSARCDVRTTAVPRRQGGEKAAVAQAPPAELVVLDAFAPEEPRIPDAARLNLGPSVEVRLEDKVQSEVIATDLLATRTVGFGHVYDVEPRRILAALEEMQTGHVIDQLEVVLEPGRLYVGMRAGRAGDPAFPQRLVVHAAQDPAEGG